MITEIQLRPFIGMAYSDDFDCADFAVHFVREFFGRNVELPGARPRGDGSENELQDLSKPYGTRTDKPVDGDFVLMFDRGYTIPTHGGIYLVVNHTPHVLHCVAKAGGSVLHPLRKLPLLGLNIEGFYKWMDR